jgi:mRNA interferase MazF
MSNFIGRRGEVWLVELNNKRRPAVIVNQETMVVELDRVIATVTTQPPRNEYDVYIKHWEEAGLDKPSVVRCSKINTLHYKDLVFKIGSLAKEDLTSVLEIIQKFFSVA